MIGLPVSILRCWSLTKPRRLLPKYNYQQVQTVNNASTVILYIQCNYSNDEKKKLHKYHLLAIGIMCNILGPIVL